MLVIGVKVISNLNAIQVGMVAVKGPAASMPGLFRCHGLRIKFSGGLKSSKAGRSRNSQIQCIPMRFNCPASVIADRCMVICPTGRPRVMHHPCGSAVTRCCIINTNIHACAAIRVVRRANIPPARNTKAHKHPECP